MNEIVNFLNLKNCDLWLLVFLDSPLARHNIWTIEISPYPLKALESSPEFKLHLFWFYWRKYKDASFGYHNLAVMVGCLRIHIILLLATKNFASLRVLIFEVVDVVHCF
jgi:hypothetical protein